MRTMACRRRLSVGLFVFMALVSRTGECLERDTEAAEDVTVAIVVSRATVENDWTQVQSSAHGWAAIANLAGVPYDTWLLEDLLDSKTGQTLLTYDAVVFVQIRHLSEPLYHRLCELLGDYLSEGGGLIVDGPPAVFDETGAERANEKLLGVLRMAYSGYHGGDDLRIRVESNHHLATRALQRGQNVTQHLDAGLDVLRFVEGGEVLLAATGPASSYPFLSVDERNGSRLVLVSNLGASAGVASFFRNHSPQGFYANRLYDPLVGALQWTVYGELATPFPTLQLANADLTAMIRLDADQSYRVDKQLETMGYLTDLAKQTGVLALYGLVSADAADAGWAALAPFAGRLEAAGGQIATHSKYHELDGELNEEIAKSELDDSVDEIEQAMHRHRQQIGKVEFFINPNNTIPMSSYEEVAKRFSFFMTHGFEQQVPLGYGNVSWFTGGARDLVVVENTPAPDYQWFYEPGWIYSPAQVAAYEEAIFDHMFHNIGRGVLFSQMWHDYGLTSSLLDPDEFDWWGLFPQEQRPNQRPLYDALAAKFATHPIYSPDAVDLGQKLRAMAQWSYSWEATDDRIRLQLDLSQTASQGLADYAGGMGIRIENHDGRIQSVRVNDKNHPAFSENVVVLPNLEPTQNEIEIHLGSDSVRSPRLVYVSKRMPSIRAVGDDITVSLLTKSKARFSFYVESPFVLLNADWQEWDLQGDHLLHGYVTSDRQVTLKQLDDEGFWIVRSALPIEDFSRTANAVRLSFDEPVGEERSFWFRSSIPPKKAVWDGVELPVVEARGVHKIEIPAFGPPGVLELSF